MGLFDFMYKKNKVDKKDNFLHKIYVPPVDSVFYDFCDIYSYHKDIVKYTDSIIKYIDYIKEDKTIPIYFIPQELYKICVGEFFTNNGYYIDQNEKIKMFYKVAIELLDIFNTIEQKNNKTYSETRNLILLSNIRNNIINIAENLRNATR